MMMSLISRLVGIHELFLFNFYPLLQRFLQPHQRDVTRILQYAAQVSPQRAPAGSGCRVRGFDVCCGSLTQ